MSWQPILPSLFYHLPSGPPTSLCQLPTASGHSPLLPLIISQNDPSLMVAFPTVRQSAPATPAPSMHIQPPSYPSLTPVPHVSKCKICKEFSGNDIEQMLHAIISVNPYLTPHSQFMDKWKEVMQIIKAEGACIGC